MRSDVPPSTFSVVVWSECVFSNIPSPQPRNIKSPVAGPLCGIHDENFCPTTLVD